MPKHRQRLSQNRFCPSCGLTTSSRFCPTDAAATIRRERLSAVASEVSTGDVIGDRYRITELLGRGGFGVVYGAVHIGTGQAVAIKMMHGSATEGVRHEDEEIRRFYREAQITASLRHHNTVRVFDVGQTEAGGFYIAMERLRGITLERRLRDLRRAGQSMTEAETLSLAIPILCSLQEAHRKGLVHRDLKPANIMLSRPWLTDETSSAAVGGADDGDADDLEDEDEILVKVLDFGVARPPDSSLTGTGTSLGTPAYMSPEQCDSGVVDGRSDLYSLGVILFRCITGEVPFHDRNPMTVMYWHTHKPPPDPRCLTQTALSNEFADLILQTLAKSTEARFSSARMLRKALEAVAADAPFIAETARYSRRGEAAHRHQDLAVVGPRDADPTPRCDAKVEARHVVEVDDSRSDAQTLTQAQPVATPTLPSAAQERRAGPIQNGRLVAALAAVGLAAVAIGVMRSDRGLNTLAPKVALKILASSTAARPTQASAAPWAIREAAPAEEREADHARHKLDRPILTTTPPAAAVAAEAKVPTAVETTSAGLSAPRPPLARPVSGGGAAVPTTAKPATKKTTVKKNATKKSTPTLRPLTAKRLIAAKKKTSPRRKPTPAGAAHAPPSHQRSKVVPRPPPTRKRPTQKRRANQGDRGQVTGKLQEAPGERLSDYFLD